MLWSTNILFLKFILGSACGFTMTKYLIQRNHTFFSTATVCCECLLCRSEVKLFAYFFSSTQYESKKSFYHRLKPNAGRTTLKLIELKFIQFFCAISYLPFNGEHWKLLTFLLRKSFIHSRHTTKWTFWLSFII